MKTIQRHNYMLSSLIIISFFIANTGCTKMSDAVATNDQNASDAQPLLME